MTRYTTPRVGLNVPNLDETPDVPRDFRILADQLDAMLYNLAQTTLLPDVVEQFLKPNYTVTTTTQDGPGNLGDVLSLKNNNVDRWLLMQTSCNLRIRIPGGTDNTVACWHLPSQSGGTTRESGMGMFATVNPSGSAKAPQMLGGSQSYRIVAVPPGGTYQSRARAWRNAGGGPSPIVEEYRLALVPLGYVVAPGAEVPDPVPVPLPPDE